MALPSTGLETKRQPEILAEIVSSEQTLIDPNINTDEDLLLGQVNTIFSTREASLQELLQDVNDGKALSKAEGTSLDDLVSVLGIRRQAATPTKGEQYFVGKEGILLASGVQVSSAATNTIYALDDPASFVTSACRACVISVSTVVDSTLYTVTINGVDYEYTSGISATELSILQGLETEYNNSPISDISVSVDAPTSLMTVSSDLYVDIVVSKDSNLKYENITIAGDVSATETGAIIQAANTVLTRQSPQSGWLDTYNPVQFITGRAEETDEELRARAKLSSSNIGLATVNAIIREVLDVSGVSYCDVIENTITDGVSDIEIAIDTITNLTLYTVSIDGVSYDYTSDASATINEISAGLAAAIQLDSPSYITAVDNTGSVTVSINNTVYAVTVSTSAELTSSGGQPSGSINVIVIGGDNQEVADTIFVTKGAGVQPWGDANGTGYVTSQVEDLNGKAFTVDFNRPQTVQIFLEITYEKYDEEVFPINGEDAMAEAVVAFGNDLGVGRDVDPPQFIGSVYGAVSGIQGVIVKAKKAAGSFDTIPISILSSEASTFSVVDVSFNLIP